MRRKTWLFGLLLPLAPMAAAAGTPGAVDGKAAFARLKSLAGTWEGTATTKTGPAATVLYEVGSAGSIVRELLFPGTDHEMMTVYHLVGADLVATHYCSAGNQPRMKLAATTADELVFDFDGGENVDPAADPHIHGGRISFESADRVYAEWRFFAGGKEAAVHKLFLARKK